MPVYGFKDRETATKLKKMVAAGSVTSASIAPNGFDEQGGFAFKNATGKTIPAFGLVFLDRLPNVGAGTTDYPSTVAYSYSQVKDRDGFETWIKDAWAFNNSMPVEPDQYGWAQARDTYVIGFDKSTAGFAAGSKFSPDTTNDFRLKRGTTADLVEFTGYQTLSAVELGASENERLIQLFVPYGRESREVDLVQAVRLESNQHRITTAGKYFDDIVTAFGTGNYPSATGAKAFLLNPGVPLTISSGGGGLGGGQTTYHWWIIEEQYLEAENPNPGGGGGTGPATP